MRVRWAPSALNSLDQILGYIAADNPDAADELAAEVRGKTALLVRFPMLGRASVISPYRELLIGRTLLLVYEIVADEVQIVMAWHTARRRPKYE